MAQIVKELRVDVSQPNVFQAIVAKQHDSNSRFLKITLVDFGVKVEVPNTAKVTINANRPDGASESFKGEANNDGTITVPLAQWMLDIDGEVKCDVSVTNTEDNKRLTSTDFWLEVQKAANPNASIPLDPDGEILIIKPVTEIDGNSKDTDYPSAKAVYDYGQSIAADTQITATATGSAITIDSANAPLQNLKLFGKTEQNGTPTPDSPIPLVSVGDSGSFEVGVYGGNILPYPYPFTDYTSDGLTFTDKGDGTLTVNGTATARVRYTLSTTLTLPKGTYYLKCVDGIADGFFHLQNANTSSDIAYMKLHGDSFTLTEKTKMRVYFYIGSGAICNNLILRPMLNVGTSALPYEPYKAKQSITFTDIMRGVDEVADEKDFARGVSVKKIHNALESGFNLSLHSATNDEYLVAWVSSSLKPKIQKMVSSHFSTIYYSQIGKATGVFLTEEAPCVIITIPKTIASDITTLKQWLIDNGVKIYYPLAEPIETPLTEKELNAYRHLMTNKGTTTILSETDMEISYYVNKPNAQAIGSLHEQINKDYFKLQQAIISTGGSTL